MKKFWKVSANAVLAAALVSSVALVTPAQAATVSQETSQVSQVNKNLKTNVLENISAMSAYITTGEDGLVHIDQNAVNVVGKETFDVYAKGVASLNTAISAGDIKVKDGILQVDKSQLSNPSAPQISPTVYGNFYWWGYALTLSDQESKQLAFNLRNAGTTIAAAAAISGLIPTPPTQLVRAISIVISAGYHTVANDISFKNNGNGVTINIHYAAYFVISSN
ncbi:hypothetical protein [Paenibacillus oleatilyticus]|uniref:hypothetical protein n=1 Tax=Paenibacillus oleatilyticus TaxID=2594886 RepID=UPI001C200AAE|nr:hypothetical protein [Paenibacillus oleatilyticus]MBU7319932.1 hypothetical protein [Paenibacillus oleatilyticus]